MKRFVSPMIFLLKALAIVSTAQAQTFTGDGAAYTLGSVSQGNCNFMASAASAATNYAAINDPQWDSLKNCGRCAQVSCIDAQCADKTVSEVVHIVDRCPECKQGDLDLSPSVFKKITGSSPSRLKIQWKFVDCPNPGNLQYCLKAGSNPYFVAIQPANAAAGVANMKINGKATTMVDSAYYFLFDGKSEKQTDLSSVSITLTSISNQAISEVVSLAPGSCTESKFQFSSGSSGSSTTSASNTETPSPTPTTPSPSTSPSPAPTTPTPEPSPSPAPSTFSPEPSPSPASATSNPEPTPSPASPSPSPSPVPSSPSPSPAVMNNTPSTVTSQLLSAPATSPSVSPHPSKHHRCKTKQTKNHKAY